MPVETEPNFAVPAVEDNHIREATSRFEENLKAANATPETTPAETPAAPAKPEVRTETKPAEATPANDGIPDEFLGIEPAKPAEDPDAKLLDEQPTGQVKHEHFTKLQTLSKARIKAAEDKLAQVEAQLKDVQSKGGVDDKTKAQLEALQKRADEAEERLNRAHFERSPQFQKMVERAEKSISDAKTYLEGTEIDSNVVDLAAKAKGAARIKILKEAGADAEQIAAIAPYLANYDSIRADQDSALASHKETAAKWESEQKSVREAEEARIKKEDERVFDSVLSKTQASMVAYRKVQGNDAWNSGVDELIAKAREHFSGQVSVEEAAEVVIAGVGAIRTAQINTRLLERLAAANKKIAELTSAQPGNSNGRSANGATIDESKLSEEDRLKSAFERNLAAAQGRI